jgi:formylmethanofuran dehydrogenase subunit C
MPTTTLEEVLQGETIIHTGNLTITGNVGENAIIHVTDGLLNILGNVENHAEITLSISDEVKQQILEEEIAAFRLKSNARMFGNVCPASKKIACDSRMQIRGYDFMLGKINIRDRIQVEGAMFTIAANTYLVMSKDNAFKHADGSPLEDENVTAVVDGRQYTGNQITISNYAVSINGKLIAPSEVPLAEPKQSPKIVIHGNIGEYVTISSATDLEIKGTKGHGYNLQNAKGIEKEASMNYP